MRTALRRSVVSPLLVAAAATLTFALSGCTADAPTPQETTAASTVPGPSASASEKEDADGASLDLPADFPDSEIPLLEGTVVVSNDLSGGYVIWVTSPDDVGNDFAAASELLVAAGFENTVSTSDEGSFYAAFTSTKWQIQLSGGDDPTYGNVIGYTIYPTS